MSRSRKAQRRSCTCSRCADDRQHQRVAADRASRLDVAAYEAEPRPGFDPEAVTGGITLDGQCWGTEVGRWALCGCFACSEVWEDLAWPLLREQYEVTCSTCGGDCRLN